jgi:uncharacterized protein (DUF58 family)
MVRGIQIRTRKLVSELLAGQYCSAFRGQGLEFREVRGYVEGDDLRALDWNVTARTGDPYVKTYQEERERTVLFVVDVSASTGFGSGEKSKAALAAEVCAVLALSAAGSQDRVGLLAFSDRIEHYVPPRRGTRHALRLLRDILSLESQDRGTAIGSALEYLLRTRIRRAVVFLLSDFRDRGFEGPLKIAARRYDLIAVRIVDPREEELPPRGLVRIADSETGAKAVLDCSSAAVRARFRGEAQSRSRALQELCGLCGADLLELKTSEPLVAPLRAFLEKRGRRFGR